MPSAAPKDADNTAAAKKKTTKKTTATAKKKTVKKAAKKATTTTTTKTPRLRVRQVKSGIRHPWRVRDTLTALGLKHHQDEVVVPDNPSIRGMLRRVHHLVSVTPEETNG
jgi:large subunit ribosomal protein L30